MARRTAHARAARRAQRCSGDGTHLAVVVLAKGEETEARVKHGGRQARIADLALRARFAVREASCRLLRRGLVVPCVVYDLKVTEPHLAVEPIERKNTIDERL